MTYHSNTEDMGNLYDKGYMTIPIRMVVLHLSHKRLDPEVVRVLEG